jgi:hypothetical protein
VNGQFRGIEVLKDVPLWAWFLLAAILLTQAYLIFNDAKKRGYNAWAWGALGLLNFPSSLIIYFVAVDMLEKARVGPKPPGSADGPSDGAAGSPAATRPKG